MGKKRSTEEFSKQRLLGTAETLKRFSEQIANAAEILGDSTVSVGGFSTCERGIDYIKRWIGSLNGAVATQPMDDPDFSPDADAESIKSEMALREKSAKKKTKSTKKKAN